MRHRGKRKGVVARNNNVSATMMAFVWMDHDRNYFIATSLSLQEGVPYVRYRWRQVNIGVDDDYGRVEVSFAQPKSAEVLL